MLKRIGILIYICALLSLGGRCCALSQFSATLTKIEKSLFGVDYSTQADDARLSRIEKVVYGQTSTSPLQSRVSKLSTDLSADLIGNEIKPKRDSFEDEDAGIKQEDIPKADKNVNYPIVDSLEKKVFNKDNKSAEINQRLSNLEQNVFKKTYSDDLNSRVERLKSAVMPEKIAQSNDSDDDSDNDSVANGGNVYSPSDVETVIPKNYDSDDMSDFPKLPGSRFIPKYNRNNSVLDEYPGDSDLAVPLAALEKTILRKSYPNDITTNRLTRLELKVFSSTFTDDDEQTRLDRIASAYQAKKSSPKYDSNRFQQHMATAMQVGAVLLMILAAVL